MLRNLELEKYRRLRRIRAEQPVAGQSARRQERLREDLDPGGDPLSGIAGRFDGSCRVHGSARRTHRCRATQRGSVVGRGWIQIPANRSPACVGGRPSGGCRPAGVNGDGLAAGRDPHPAHQHGAGGPPSRRGRGTQRPWGCYPSPTLGHTRRCRRMSRTCGGGCARTSISSAPPSTRDRRAASRVPQGKAIAG